jgi:MFS family permease
VKVDAKKTLKVGLAFANILAFWGVYNTVMPLLLENAFGFSNMIRGLIMGMGSLIALIIMPVFGRLSDKSKGKLATKFGRRTPFVVLGTVVAAILIIFVPFSAHTQTKNALELRQNIMLHNDLCGFESRETLYTHLWNTGGDFADVRWLEEELAEEGTSAFDKYMHIALNRYQLDEAGEIVRDEHGDPIFTDEYNRFVRTGLNAFASTQIFEQLTRNNVGTVVTFMLLLFIVLVAMAIYRSPAIALMPDVTPKPLRSPANGIIALIGGVGGGIASVVYAIVFMFPITFVSYTIIFAGVAGIMLGLLAAFLLLVKEVKLVKENELLCLEYGVDDEEEAKKDKKEQVVEMSAEVAEANEVTMALHDAEVAKSELGVTDNKPINLGLDANKTKKARMVSFFLILASIFMWFFGFQAIQTNLMIFLTKNLGLSEFLATVVNFAALGFSAVAFIPVGFMAMKFGRRKTVIIGFIMAAVAILFIFLFASRPGNAAPYLFALFYLIANFGMVIGNVNTLPMVVELSAKETLGKYTGYYYVASMSAQAITPLVAGLVMDTFASRYLFIYAFAFVAAAAVLMFFVKHGDSKPLPKAKAAK